MSDFTYVMVAIVVLAIGLPCAAGLVAFIEYSIGEIVKRVRR